MTAVVIPCYRVKKHILEVIAAVGPEVHTIYVVDDKCPEETGPFVEEHCRDPRVRVLYHSLNQGVGAATITGYRRALADGADVTVKVDGDGQMDPALIPRFVRPLVEGAADYAKGNRFFDVDSVRQMPLGRLMGNALLSFLTKFSTGYWDIFDPTNGFTAIHAKVAQQLPLDKISKRYFFESDMLFRLNILRAVIVDVPMMGQYGSEVSNLKLAPAIFEFAGRHGINFLKRLFYSYYLRNFNVASIEIMLALVLLTFGITFGIRQWYESHVTGTPASSGTVMLAALPIIIGVQLVLAFLTYGSQQVPRLPLHKRL